MIKPRHSSDVFILGAGFSHAISEDMPLTDGLGAKLMKRADAQRILKFGGNFELQLSFLAQDHPFLSASQNLKNRALFFDMVITLNYDCLVEEIVRAMIGKREVPPFGWLDLYVAPVTTIWQRLGLGAIGGVASSRMKVSGNQESPGRGLQRGDEAAATMVSDARQILAR